MDTDDLLPILPVAIIMAAYYLVNWALAVIVVIMLIWGLRWISR